jgi:hypothetical protein
MGREGAVQMRVIVTAPETNLASWRRHNIKSGLWTTRIHTHYYEAAIFVEFLSYLVRVPAASGADSPISHFEDDLTLNQGYGPHAYTLTTTKLLYL